MVMLPLVITLLHLLLVTKSISSHTCIEYKDGKCLPAVECPNPLTLSCQVRTTYKKGTFDIVSRGCGNFEYDCSDKFVRFPVDDEHEEFCCSDSEACDQEPSPTCLVCGTGMDFPKCEHNSTSAVAIRCPPGNLACVTIYKSKTDNVNVRGCLGIGTECLSEGRQPMARNDTESVCCKGRSVCDSLPHPEPLSTGRAQLDYFVILLSATIVSLLYCTSVWSH